MSFKKANYLLREGKLLEAKKVYTELEKKVDRKIQSEVAFNLNIIEKKLTKKRSNNKRITSNNLSDKVFVGIASIPQREYALRQTINSLSEQVDQIGVFLDGYDAIPSFLLENAKVVVKQSQDFSRKVGDAGKFFWVDSHDGFYFTCDDDLIYPDDFVFRIKNKIYDAGEPVVVGWHGSLLLSPFKNYYNKNSRRVFTFGSAREKDTPVHILGTGCLGFHTNSFRVRFCDFPSPNMADVYFAKLGQEQKVPFLVIEHAKDEITEVPDTREISIYQHSHTNQDTSHNTKTEQNEVVRAINWSVNYATTHLNILIIGRFNINKKGGVYKSSKLLEDGLRSLGHRVDTCCLSQLSEFDFDRSKYDFSIVYAPDPERPDFADCISRVKILADKNTVCAVNFSFNQDLNRTEWIEKTLLNLNSSYKNPRVFFASFSNSTLSALKDVVHEMVIPFPKTIALGSGYVSNKIFSEREGIFLGDLAKLLNPKLTHGEILPWIEELARQLPHVNIYALKHYHTDLDYPKNIKLIPYSNNIADVLNQFRLCVNLTPGATFEMVPLEALLSGTPTIHRRMPQSLSEYLSPVSIEISSPVELAEVCRRIYDNEEIWKRLSAAGASAFDFFKVDNVIAALDIAIRKCINRAGQ